MNVWRKLPKFPTPKPCRTKIVATVGPASSEPEVLRQMILAGADVLRINFAHRGAVDDRPLIETIRRVADELDRPVAILADLAGPKIRLGELPDGELNCRFGEELTLVRGAKSNASGTLTSTYPLLVDDVKLGDKLLLADGTVAFEVVDKGPTGALCRVVREGVVRSRQGIATPGVELSLETITPTDRENAIWAVKLGIDFLGLSFVRSAADVFRLREILATEAESNVGSRLWNETPPEERSVLYPNIVAKIEKAEALERLEEIVDAADATMVARGDLGVEIDVAKIAIAQKRILETCLRFGKPSIVATQALESMTRESVPTRAEVSDVSNAILDGADACMTSAETAIGKNPVLVVETMNRVAFETEKALRRRSLTERRTRFFLWDTPFDESLFETPVDDETRAEKRDAEAAKTAFERRREASAQDKVALAVCDAAASLADATSAALLLVSTRAGKTALNVSNARVFTMTIGASSNVKTLRRMCLYWGVTPIYSDRVDARETFETLTEAALAQNYVVRGDRVVMTVGVVPPESETNAVYVGIVGAV